MLGPGIFLLGAPWAVGAGIGCWRSPAGLLPRSLVLAGAAVDGLAFAWLAGQVLSM